LSRVFSNTAIIPTKAQVKSRLHTTCCFSIVALIIAEEGGKSGDDGISDGDLQVACLSVEEVGRTEAAALRPIRFHAYSADDDSISDSDLLAACLSVEEE
jgi:hypothetical protein